MFFTTHTQSPICSSKLVKLVPQRFVVKKIYKTRSRWAFKIIITHLASLHIWNFIATIFLCHLTWLKTEISVTRDIRSPDRDFSLHVDVRIKTLNASPLNVPRVLLSRRIYWLEFFIIFHRVGAGHAKSTRSVHQRCKSLFAALSVCLVALARIYPGTRGRYVSIYLPTSGCCKRRYLRRITRGM